MHVAFAKRHSVNRSHGASGVDPMIWLRHLGDSRQSFSAVTQTVLLCIEGLLRMKPYNQ